jgi:hypothetical protein
MVEESPDDAAKSAKSAAKKAPAKRNAAKRDADAAEPAERTGAKEPARPVLSGSNPGKDAEPAADPDQPAGADRPADSPDPDGPGPQAQPAGSAVGVDGTQPPGYMASSAADNLPIVEAARLDPPVRPVPPPSPVFLGSAVTSPAHPHSHHHGFFDGESGNRIDELSDAFEPVPGMATMMRTNRRIVERHRVPNTQDVMTDRLLFARGVQVPQSVAEALVATSKVVKPAE